MLKTIQLEEYFKHKQKNFEKYSRLHLTNHTDCKSRITMVLQAKILADISSFYTRVLPQCFNVATKVCGFLTISSEPGNISAGCKSPDSLEKCLNFTSRLGKVCNLLWFCSCDCPIDAFIQLNSKVAYFIQSTSRLLQLLHGAYDRIFGKQTGLPRTS